MPVEADPDELENFAQTLSTFCANMMEELGRLNGGFESLSDSWRDVKQQEFAEILSSLTQQLQQFSEVSDENVKYLLQQAERLREYLNA